MRKEKGDLPMRIIGIDPVAFHGVKFANPAPRHLGGGPRESVLHFFRGDAEGLPASVAGIVAAGDLQGRDLARSASGERRLLGELVAAELAILSGRGEIPRQDELGVLLAGDFWAHPGLDRRGGAGDVRPVYRAFSGCRCVVGVAGNHDFLPGKFSDRADRSSGGRPPGVHILDGRTIELEDGDLRVGGVGGIVGQPPRLNRRLEPSFVTLLERVLAERPAVVLMHDGPDHEPTASRGVPAIRAVLEREKGPLVIRSHRHWLDPLAELSSGTQVLNVCERVVVLRSVTPLQRGGA